MFYKSNPPTISLLLIHLASVAKRSSIHSFLKIHFPTSLEIFDGQHSYPHEGCVNMSLWAAVQASLVIYFPVIGIYLFFDGLVNYEAMDLARFSGINLKCLAGKTVVGTATQGMTNDASYFFNRDNVLINILLLKQWILK